MTIRRHRYAGASARPLLEGDPGGFRLDGLQACEDYAGVIRPSVQFTVKELARRLAAPTGADWLRLNRLLGYVLAGMQNYVLNLAGNDDSDAPC